MTHPVKKSKSVKEAWGIKSTIHDFDGKTYVAFQGVYCWTHDIPDCMDGQRTALFRTRRIAIKAMQSLYKSKMYKYEVLKVKVVITELPPKGRKK